LQGVACDADKEAVPALPVRPSKPGRWSASPSLLLPLHFQGVACDADKEGGAGFAGAAV
jgi:hypothetical protein